MILRHIQEMTWVNAACTSTYSIRILAFYSLATQWMAAPFVLSALPLPEALGLWNGSFFTSYPLTLGTLDPAFTMPGAAVLAQCLVLAAGVLLLALQPKRLSGVKS